MIDIEKFIQVSVISESKAWIQEGELQADEMPRLVDILLAGGSLLQFCINLERKKKKLSALEILKERYQLLVIVVVNL